MVKKTFNLIEKARKVHGNKYDYSKVEYVNSHTKICIICPKHGEFWQIPYAHLKGQGCPKCWEERKGKDLFSNTKEFIEKAKKIHGDKYNYSKVEYVNSKTKVCIICPIHGEFWQSPNKHLSGEGCPKCGKNKAIEKHLLKKDNFAERAIRIHNTKYIYDKTDVNDRDEKGRVVITCPIHGDFLQTPHNHLLGKGCPKCGMESRANKKRLTQDEVIGRFIEKYGNKYDYSKVTYEKMHSDVVIICSKHGDFLCTPANHLSGKGCPKCKMSHIEQDVEKMLKDNGIDFQYEVNKKTLPWLNTLSLDFYLPEYNIAIECQGKQHFKPINYFGGDEKLKYVIKLDKVKKQLCENNNVRLLYYSNENIDFPYEVNKSLTELLTKILN